MNLHKIPHTLILALILGFYAFAFATGLPSGQIMSRSITGVAALLIAFVSFKFGIINGGVAKLLATAFLWLGLSSGLTFTAISLILTYLCGFAVMKINKDSNGNMPYLPFAALTVVIMAVFGGLDITPDTPDDITTVQAQIQ